VDGNGLGLCLMMAYGIVALHLKVLLSEVAAHCTSSHMDKICLFLCSIYKNINYSE